MEGEELTSGDNPTTTLAERELVNFQARGADLHKHFALMHKKDHLHLPTVLGPLEAAWWKLYNAGPEERNRHDLRILELGARNVSCHDRRRSKRNIWLLELAESFTNRRNVNVPS